MGGLSSIGWIRVNSSPSGTLASISVAGLSALYTLHTPYLADEHHRLWGSVHMQLVAWGAASRLHQVCPCGQVRI